MFFQVESSTYFIGEGEPGKLSPRQMQRQRANVDGLLLMAQYRFYISLKYEFSTMACRRSQWDSLARMLRITLLSTSAYHRH